MNNRSGLSASPVRSAAAHGIANEAIKSVDRHVWFTPGRFSN